MTGKVLQQPQRFLAELDFQGMGTQRFVLRISDLVTGIMTVQLEAASPSPNPIITWRSEALAGEARVQLRGMFDVNIEELAAFLAPLLPLGSDWAQAAGRIQANWVVLPHRRPPWLSCGVIR